MRGVQTRSIPVGIHKPRHLLMGQSVSGGAPEPAPPAGYPELEFHLVVPDEDDEPSHPFPKACRRGLLAAAPGAQGGRRGNAGPRLRGARRGLPGRPPRDRAVARPRVRADGGRRPHGRGVPERGAPRGLPERPPGGRELARRRVRPGGGGRAHRRQPRARDGVRAEPLPIARWLVWRFALTAEDARVRNNEALRFACRGGHLAIARWLAAAFGLGRRTRAR